jgi:hypothetical protein
LNWADMQAADVVMRTRGRALDVNVALAVGLEVFGVDLEFLGRGVEHHRARLLGGGDDGVADAVGAARGERAHAVRAGVGVGGVDIDVLDRHAEGFRGDLAGHRLHALAEVDGGERDGELAVGVGVHQGLARVAAEVHADGIVDGGDAAAAMFGHAQRLLVPKMDENRLAAGRGAAGRL